ncbi:MAG: response regulator [Candidatus Xenobiia bacterium LiM19]
MACKILIVEDEMHIAEVIKDNLEEFGYEVSAMVDNEKDAILKIRESLPDLLMMDIVLDRNGEDGIEIAERIKKEFQIPVVFISGYYNKDYMERAKLIEPMGYIIKPFKSTDLKAVVEMALFRAMAERERQAVYQQIARRLEMEKVISSISQQFVGMLSIDEGIRKSLALLGKLRKAEYAYFCLFCANEESCECIYDWRILDDINEEHGTPRERAFCLIPTWIEKLKKGEIIHIRSVSGASDDKMESEKSLLDKDLHSFLIIPVQIMSKVVGFIGFESKERATDWTDDDVMLVRVASEIIFQVYERKKYTEELNSYRNRLQDVVSLRTKELSDIILKLEQEILQNKLTEEKLKTSLRDMDILIREIHHRVKSIL